MDPGSGLPSVTLTPAEQQAFQHYFLAADVDKDGMLNQGEAVNFLRQSGLDNSLLAEIWNIVNANQQNRLNPNAFSVACRLIGLAQRGVPPSLMTLASTSSYPMPNFQGVASPQTPPPHSMVTVAQPQGNIYNSTGGSHTLNSNNPYAVALSSNNPYSTNSAPLSPNSPAIQRTQSAVGQDQWTISPEKRQSFLQMFATAPKMNPNAMNGTEARNFLLKSNLNQASLSQIWNLATQGGDSLGPESFCIAMHLCHCSLAGTPLPATLPPSLAMSARGGAAGGMSSDPWAVTPENQAKYRQYFAQANPVNGQLGAVAAKNLFMQSQLGQDDLAKIWNLSDMNKDGQLDEREFIVAMHLVDLRRLKNQPIPQQLPPQVLQSIGGGAGGSNALVTQGSGPSFFGQHSHAQMIAQQEAEQKARREIAAVQTEIAKRLQSKEEIITKLRQVQEANLTLARNLSVKGQTIARAGAAIHVMEAYGKQQLLRNDALKQLSDGVRQVATPLFEYKQVLGKIFEERQAAVAGEQERQAVLESQIDSAKQMVQQQQLDIARLQGEIQTLVQQNQLKAQRKAELAAKKAAEEELARRKTARLAEEKRIAEAKAKLEEQKRQLEIAKQNALMEAQVAASRLVEAEENEKKQQEARRQQQQAAAAAAAAPASGGGDGEFLDEHQANTYYTEYADDFGTLNGGTGGGPADFYFPPGHPKFSPGFFPENPDYGSMFALGPPQANAGGAPVSPSSPPVSRNYDEESSSETSSDEPDVVSPFASAAPASAPTNGEDELDQLFSVSGAAAASSASFSHFDAPLFDE
eukprot:TRINITY_DN2269_c0_g1_i1.p1 TRINITY_DN2269_c0_g1~~TRINITY_DN2269_c0_g1_i1.p1  ORF type:complete len:844 (+),score=222.56 TRINITY_DN2269_c0_g1_i1:117-2534(+)